MPTENNTDISDKLAELQQRYYAQLPERINEIESLWQNYNIKSPDESLLNDLHRHAHTLMGLAGTF